MFAAGAAWMAMINLFNLLPINPLDGGRVMKSIAFSIHSWFGYVFMIIGIIASIFLAIYAHIWIFILVVILSSLELVVEFYFNHKRRKEEIEYKEQCDKLNAKMDVLRKEHIEKGIPIPTTSVLNVSLPEIEITPEKPTMNIKEIVLAVLQYFALAIILYIFMEDTMHIPGAALAMDILR
jgi:hypothetical protein